MGKHTNVDVLIVEDDPRDVELTLRALRQPESATENRWGLLTIR